MNKNPKNQVEFGKSQHDWRKVVCDSCGSIEDSINAFRINGKIYCLECYPLKNQLEAFAKKYFLSKRGMSNNQQQLIKRQYDRL